MEIIQKNNTEQLKLFFFLIKKKQKKNVKVFQLDENLLSNHTIKTKRKYTDMIIMNNDWWSNFIHIELHVFA